MATLLEPPPPPAAPPSGRRVGSRLAVALVLAGLIGGLAATGMLALAGAIGESQNTATSTTVLRGSGAATGLDVSALYAGAADGVVDITSTTTTTVPSPNPFGGGESRQATATGTGFVVDGDGHIVTAAHVVNDATKVTVKFRDGTTRDAKVLGTDNASDIAVLGVDPSGLTLHPLTLGSSGALKVGDPVAAIGDPFDYDRSISSGVVSGLDRTIEAPNGFTVPHAIQTDAALNPGNSGGPLLDAGGRVIGVVDQIATSGSADQSSGVGFAVPAQIVKSELQDLINGTTVEHAYLGVSASDATGTLPGALVDAVTAGSPADDAGIRAGDVIVAADGSRVTGGDALIAVVAGHHPGDTLRLTVRRGSQTMPKTVTLGTQPTTRSGSNG